MSLFNPLLDLCIWETHWETSPKQIMNFEMLLLTDIPQILEIYHIYLLQCSNIVSWNLRNQCVYVSIKFQYIWLLVSFITHIIETTLQPQKELKNKEWCGFLLILPTKEPCNLSRSSANKPYNRLPAGSSSNPNIKKIKAWLAAVHQYYKGKRWKASGVKPEVSHIESFAIRIKMWE